MILLFTHMYTTVPQANGEIYIWYLQIHIKAKIKHDMHANLTEIREKKPICISNMWLCLKFLHPLFLFLLFSPSGSSMHFFQVVWNGGLWGWWDVAVAILPFTQSDWLRCIGRTVVHMLHASNMGEKCKNYLNLEAGESLNKLLNTFYSLHLCSRGKVVRTKKKKCNATTKKCIFPLLSTGRKDALKWR